MTTGMKSTASRARRKAGVGLGLRPLVVSLAHLGSFSRTTVISTTPGRPTEAIPWLSRSDFSLAAVVVRSSMIATSTIARPATAAPPTSRFCSAATTGLPRPGLLTKAAMVAIDSAAIVHWLMPTTMVRRAIGSCTWRSSWRLVTPSEPAASIVVSGTERMPCSVIRTSGGSA